MNELLKPFAEIRTCHTDDNNFTHVDGWRTEDDQEPGISLALVCRDTSKIIYLDNIYRTHPQVQDAIREVLEDIKIEQMAAGLNEGEAAVPTVNGQFLVFPAADKNPDGCDYIRIVDNDGNELVYWDSQEWADDPQLVMGAIMGAIQHGAE